MALRARAIAGRCRLGTTAEVGYQLGATTQFLPVRLPMESHVRIEARQLQGDVHMFIIAAAIALAATGHWVIAVIVALVAYLSDV